MFADHISRKKDYIAALTGLRGIAACWVFVYHAWFFSGAKPIILNINTFQIDLTSLFAAGWIGVYLFFALSGFLLSQPFFNAALNHTDRPNLKYYFSRRILRVFPAYYCQLAILICVAFVFETDRTLSFNELIAHLFMFLNIGPDPVRPMNGVWWTLPVEFGFYLILPLIAIFFKPRHFKWFFIASILLSILYRFIVYQNTIVDPVETKQIIMDQLPGTFSLFMCGCLAAYWWIRQQYGLVQLPNYLTANRLVILSIIFIGILILILNENAAVYWTGNILLYIWQPLIGLSIAILLVGIANNSWISNAVFANRVVLLLGVISYSIYLWHLPIILWLTKSIFVQSQINNVFDLLFISIPIVLLVSMVSYEYSELVPVDRVKRLVVKVKDN